MLKFSKRKLLKLMRDWHRDLGYLMVGISLVYGLSGIMLNHIKTTDPSYRIRKAEITIQKDATKQQVKDRWDAEDLPTITLIKPEGNHWTILCRGGEGAYDTDTGVLSYAVYMKRPLMYWINLLHYNRVNSWTYVADIFAVSLIFFAISGLFLVQGRKGVAGRGKWILMIGFLIPILFIVFG